MVRLVAGQIYADHAPGTDFAAIATAALVEAQTAFEQVAALEDYAQALNRRIREGYAWLDANSAFHPQYQRGVDLIAELQHKHTETRWQLRDAKVALMGHALTFWQAYDRLTPLEQQAISFTHGDISHIERPTTDSYREWMQRWNELEIRT